MHDITCDHGAPHLCVDAYASGLPRLLRLHAEEAGGAGHPQGLPGELEKPGICPASRSRLSPLFSALQAEQWGGNGREDRRAGSVAAALWALQEGGGRRTAAAISHQMSPSAAKAAADSDNGLAVEGRAWPNPKPRLC